LPPLHYGEVILRSKGCRFGFPRGRGNPLQKLTTTSPRRLVLNKPVGGFCVELRGVGEPRKERGGNYKYLTADKSSFSLSFSDINQCPISFGSLLTPPLARDFPLFLDGDRIFSVF